MVTTIAGAAGAQLAPIRPVCPVRYRGLQLRVGQAQPGLISLDRRVRLPDPPLRPGTQIGIAARSRASCLWVRLPPGHCKTIPWSNGEDAWVTMQESAGSIPAGITGKNGL